MKAWQLLDKPEKWTQHSFARDSSGFITGVNDPATCSWCALGAVAHCYSLEQQCDVHNKLLNHVNNVLNLPSTPIWNDSSTYEEVVTVLKELDI